MPTLTLDALRKRLADRNPGAVHLFVGDDVKLMARMIDAVEAVIDEGDRPFAVDHLHAGEAGGSPIDIAAAARNMPMLGERRIVIVRRAERLLKPKRAGRATEDDDEDASSGGDDDKAVDASPLEEYLTAPVPFSTLVFVATEIDRTRRLTKRVIEHGLVTVFDGNERDDPKVDSRTALAGVLRGALAREGRTIEPAAQQLLLRRAAGDVSKLRDDIEKLILFAGERKALTEDDVMAVSADHQSIDDEWAVPNAIAAGDAAGALVEMARRLERGDSVHALVGQLRWWVSNRLATADAGRVKPALEALLRTDMALKSSGGDERVLVERLVVELTGRPVANQGRRW